MTGDLVNEPIHVISAVLLIPRWHDESFTYTCGCTGRQSTASGTNRHRTTTYDFLVGRDLTLSSRVHVAPLIGFSAASCRSGGQNHHHGRRHRRLALGRPPGVHRLDGLGSRPRSGDFASLLVRSATVGVSILRSRRPLLSHLHSSSSLHPSRFCRRTRITR